MQTAVSIPTSSAEPVPGQKCPVFQYDPREADLDDGGRDYLFDLRGFDIIRGALSADQLKRINAFVDAHPIGDGKPGEWLGNVETHTYGGSDGMNFQNIIEGGPVFE